MEEPNWYSKWYKERYEKQFNKKPETKPEQKETKKPEFKPYYSKPYYPSLTKPEKIIAEPIEEEKPKPDPYKVLADVEKKLVPEINKKYIILGTLVIILAILGGIYLFTQESPKTRFMPIDVSVYNSTGLPMSVYYNNKYLLGISGFESKLEYSNKTDRLFGNEQYKKVIFDEKGNPYTVISLDNEIRIEPLKTDPTKVTRIGWFAKPEEVLVKEGKSFGKKQVSVLLKSSQDHIKNASINYYLYKGKPYLKLQFSAEAENNSELGDFSYGLTIQNNDIYLPTGEILENNNEVIYSNKTVELTLAENNSLTKNISKSLAESARKEADFSRKAITRRGSSHEDNSEYQIFIDKNKTKAIIVYSPYILIFEDSFLWNVYWVNVLKLEDGIYSQIYLIVIDNPNLVYDESKQDWILDSKQYKGPVKSYISEVINNIGDE